MGLDVRTPESDRLDLSKLGLPKHLVVSETPEDVTRRVADQIAQLQQIVGHKSSSSEEARRQAFQDAFAEPDWNKVFAEEQAS